MIRYALARPITSSRRPVRALAAAAPVRLARLAAAAIAMLALALALAAVCRADNAVLEARPPRQMPALDARVDGMRSARTPAPARKPATVMTVDPSAVKAGVASTAPAVATPTAAPPPREAKPEKLATADGRAENAATATAKDVRRTAPLDDDARDVLADLGRELRDLGRWLTEHDWE